jgi:hypothetical protein
MNWTERIDRRWLLVIAALVYALNLCGCSLVARPASTPAVDLHPPLPEQIVTDPSDPVQVAAAQVARAQAALASAKADLAAAKAQVAAAEQAHLSSLLAWVSGLALLGSIACAAAAFLVPVGKRWCAIGSIACIGVLAMAWGLRALLPFLPWIGLAVLAGIVVIGVVALRRGQIAAMLAADHADRMEKTDPSDPLLLLEQKVDSMGDQAKAGVWQLLEALRVKADAVKGRA